MGKIFSVMPKFCGLEKQFGRGLAQWVARGRQSVDNVGGLAGVWDMVVWVWVWARAWYMGGWGCWWWVWAGAWGGLEGLSMGGLGG